MQSLAFLVLSLLSTSVLPFNPSLSRRPWLHFAQIPRVAAVSRSTALTTPLSRPFSKAPSLLFSSPADSNLPTTTDPEVQQLLAAAAALRAQAAELEVSKREEELQQISKAFDSFDLDGDGSVSLEELRIGMNKLLKTEISEEKIRQVLDAFDEDDSGTLERSEFKNPQQLKMKLDEIVREDKEKAVEARKKAKEEEEKAKLEEARLTFLNDKPATINDRILSVLPYLFPLMDGLQYGRFLLQTDQVENNPVILAVSVIYILYRSVPLSGFLAFFTLSFLSGNPKINRLIRFNLQQSIFLDIALIFPGLLLGISRAVAPDAMPAGIGEILTDGVFVALLVTLGYCVGSSLLGKEPGSLPIIGDAVRDRMPTIDMFDDQGRFIPREMRKKDDGGGEGKDKK